MQCEFLNKQTRNSCAGCSVTKAILIESKRKIKIDFLKALRNLTLQIFLTFTAHFF